MMIAKLELIAWILLDASFIKLNIKCSNNIYSHIVAPFGKKLANKYSCIMNGITKYNLLQLYDRTHY